MDLVELMDTEGIEIRVGTTGKTTKGIEVKFFDQTTKGIVPSRLVIADDVPIEPHVVDNTSPVTIFLKQTPEPGSDSTNGASKYDLVAIYSGTGTKLY